MGTVSGVLPPEFGEHQAAEMYSLVARLESCGARVEEVVAGSRDIQLLDWQSPAGEAYRETVARQGVQLGQALDSIEEARIAVARHAQQRAQAAPTDDSWR
ncbi:hypothetical protein ACLH0K_17400 [Arthrobacter sp. MPF02]|uniref:hypothetical protein n=1 Tax=Arthrobacter sp. MPF02 TaxID=3388492 RepID=UPI003984F1B5